MSTGNGVTLNTAAWALKNGIYLLAQKTFAAQADANGTPTYVSMGLPSTTDPFEIVSVGEVRTNQTAATLGTNRGREETLQVVVTISVFQGGQDDTQPYVEQRAFALLSMLERAVHYTADDGTDGTTLGGTVRECFLTDVAQDSMSVTEGTTAGREAVVVATFTAKARVTK